MWPRLGVFASCNIRHMGFTTELLFVLMAISRRGIQFIMHAPAATLRLVERSLSTDDLEAEFGILVNGCGYKPSFEAVGSYHDSLSTWTSCSMSGVSRQTTA